jgi:outer membrane protein OmpA-like peptidoglycan-associated protein/opacity protein-like surface antigen
LDQPQSNTQHDNKQKAGPPKVELFLGYSYLRAIPTYATGNRLVWMNGGSASAAFNLNRYFGLVADVGGFADSQLNLTGPGVPVPHVAASGGNAYTYLFGPRLSYRKHERITPFAQVLFGGIHASPVTLDGCTGTGCVPLPAQTAFAMTAGAGLDIGLTRHVAFRAVQAEYLMTRFPNPTTQASASQNDIRISSGIVFRLGGSPTPPPLTYSCSVSPTSVYPGEPIVVTGVAVNLSSKHPAVYTWSTDGGKMTGHDDTATIDTSSTSAGSYTVQGHVSQTSRQGGFADCSAPYTVLAYQPPTISCSADPSSLNSGDTARIIATAQSPQNRPLTYSYSASTGAIHGTGANATLVTAGANPGSITITCNVMDDKGQSATATTSVTIQTPPPVTVIATRRLCSVDFVRDQKRPTRVNNEAKACLDDVALNLQRNADAKLALVGHSDHDTSADAAAVRAMHTREYLVTDKGIDSSRISIYTGSSGSRSVDTILIPAGASLDATGLTPGPTK